MKFIMILQKNVGNIIPYDFSMISGETKTNQQINKYKRNKINKSEMRKGKIKNET